MPFDHLGLSDNVMRAVEAAGYTTPTPIQEQGIPPAVEGRDVIGRAQTGTGKTAAFALPILTRFEAVRPQAREDAPGSQKLHFRIEHYETRNR